jgi:hypothetical protein
MLHQDSHRGALFIRECRMRSLASMLKSAQCTRQILTVWRAFSAVIFRLTLVSSDSRGWGLKCEVFTF